MEIAHIGIWTSDLEAMKDFYTHYFRGISNEKYTNSIKKFESYFITFECGVKLELMRTESILKDRKKEEQVGIAHIAFSFGSKDEVLLLTEKLRLDGIRIIGEPRTTGDGYFESIVLDVEGNRIELLF
jgi:catechol 2,3-dioxygenase-like lactoylglutathione lyase family enzyme